MSALLNINPENLSRMIVANNPTAVVERIRKIMPTANFNFTVFGFDTFKQIMIQQGATLKNTEDAGRLFMQVLDVPIQRNGFHGKDLTDLQTETGYSLTNILAYVFDGRNRSNLILPTSSVPAATADLSSFVNPTNWKPWVHQISSIGGVLFFVVALFFVVLALWRSISNYFTK